MADENDMYSLSTQRNVNSSINSKDNLPITDIEKHSTSFNVNGNLCKLSDECKISFSDQKASTKQIINIFN